MTETLRLSPLDIHFADFIVRIDRHPCDELWWGAALASHATGRGHSCFLLSDLPEPAALAPQSPRNPPPSDVDQWCGALEQCDTVGAPGEYTPLILDRVGRLYLQRCWGYEQQVASGILSRIKPGSSDEQGLDAALDRYFPPQGEGVDLQRSAARMALTHRFSVISGGPGSGKTATAARILALLLAMGGDSRPKITLAAPTGKAALRLQQSIIQAAGRLALPDDLRDALPTEVRTIHRLLGVRSRGGGFRHNRDNRLPCDILLVDEASMVDLQLMSSTLEALRDDTRVILLGDRNQLASVEAGAVLADICDSEERASVPVTQLTKSYRFGDNSGIAALSRLINSGDSAGATALLNSGEYPDILWRQLPTGRSFDGEFAAAVRDGYADYVQAVSPEEALARLNSFKVLSPLRGGPVGVENLNRLCQAALNVEQTHDAQSTFMAPFMITGNNYELGLYNGDTGVVTGRDDGRTVWFENPDGGLRHISLLRLPPGDAAFALTVHKSQGSEVDRVLLILPDQVPDVLSRELLYTAVTRARSRIEIWGTEEVFRQAVERRTVRKSGLQDALSGGVS